MSIYVSVLQAFDAIGDWFCRARCVEQTMQGLRPSTTACWFDGGATKVVPRYAAGMAAGGGSVANEDKILVSTRISKTIPGPELSRVC